MKICDAARARSGSNRRRFDGNPGSFGKTSRTGTYRYQTVRQMQPRPAETGFGVDFIEEWAACLQFFDLEKSLPKNGRRLCRASERPTAANAFVFWLPLKGPRSGSNR
jgi:hypothetical protein